MIRARVCLIAALVLGVGTCGGDAAPPVPVPDEAIRIGAFNFTESELLAEIYAQVLEERGLPVARLGPIGPREVVEPALELGLIDVVPEYAGTMLEFVNLGAGEATAETETTTARLRSLLGPRGLTALDPADAQDRNAFVVRKQFAAEEGVRSISDLIGLAPDLVFGGPPECPERYFCLGGLAEVYGMEFGTFTPLPFGVIAEALRSEEIDVGLLFSTDPDLAEPDLVVLADDRGLQPAENVVPVVRSDAVERWGPEMASALNGASRELDTIDLVTMHATFLETDGEAGAIAAIVRDWLSERGLVG